MKGGDRNGRTAGRKAAKTCVRASPGGGAAGGAGLESPASPGTQSQHGGSHKNTTAGMLSLSSGRRAAEELGDSEGGGGCDLDELIPAHQPVVVLRVSTPLS